MPVPYRSCETTLPASRTVAYSLSSAGVVPCVFLPARGPFGCDPLAAGDTARVADRTRTSAVDKTRNHPVPAAAQTANPVASCLPDFARSAPRWLSPEDLVAPPAYGDCVRLSGWL